jgi:ABC-2 type transport system ATP-binding protein
LGAKTMIRVEHLTKKFDKFTAVDDISFTVAEGESFGFLGPNGAGKTTTIRMLTTLIPPTKGRAEVAGYDVVKKSDRVRENIGIIFQEPSLDERLTAYDNLFFHAALYRVPRREIRTRIEKALLMVELEKFKDLEVKTFSGGMKRRLEIARGFLHMPKVLFLDEPTLGLDPQTRRAIWEYIRGLKEDFGVTLFLTTHYMEEAEESDRVGIIHKGKIITVDSPGNMKKRIGEETIILSAIDGNEKKVKALGYDSTREGEKILLKVEKSEDVLKKLLDGGINIENLTIKRPTLEDVFIELTGTAIKDDAPGDPMDVIRRATRIRRMNQ